MADNKFQIWAELTVDNKQIQTEFTKAWEVAGKSVAEWLDKQQGTVIDKIKETTDYMKQNIEELKNIDFNVELDSSQAEQNLSQLSSEITSVWYTVENLKYSRQEFWDEWAEAFNELQTTAEEYTDTLYNTMDQIQYMWIWIDESMEQAEDSTKQTTEAVKELNEEANKGISENGGLWKMLKFLGSAQIVKGLYNWLKKIWTKLIELSGDSEMLWEKRSVVQGKLEAVWWYIGKWLTPVLEWVMEDINELIDWLIGTGEAWMTGASMIQKWVFIIATVIRWIVKVIKSLWEFYGAWLGWLWTTTTSFISDLYNSVVGAIKGIWNVNNWKAVWNNIKVWIVNWVNGAIEAVNGMLNWLRDKLWIDLWNIKTFDAGERMEYDFDISFEKTKNAMQAMSDWMDEVMNDVGKDWADFFNDTKEWWKSLWNTAIYTNKKIEKDTKKTMWKGWKVSDVYDELEDEAQKMRDELDEMVEDHQKNYDKLKESIKKIEDEFQKLRDSAKDVWEDAEKSLKSYNEELNKTQSDTITDLWQRYVELKKDLIWVDEWMKQVAKDASWEDIQNKLNNWNAYIGWYDIKDVIDLKQKLEELQLIEENTTEEQRKGEQFIKETSKTQEILNKLKEKELEIEEKKAIALEKQAIATAMQENTEWQNNFKTLVDEQTQELKARYKDRDWVRQEIHNQDNIEYAKQLETQVSGLNEQRLEYKKEKDMEVEYLISANATKQELEEQYTKVMQENAKKQKQELDGLIAKTQQLINKKRELLSLWGWGTSARAYGWSVLEGQASIVWENGPEQIIARQSSYVQPRNASNSYSTTHNTNNLSLNWVSIGNYNTVEDMFEDLKQYLTYRS